MQTILADAARFTGPVVIAGDFNSYGIGVFLERHGYRWLTRDIGPTISFFTWDHIFVRGLAPAGQGRAGVVRANHGASDHRPVWAVVVPGGRCEPRPGKGGGNAVDQGRLFYGQPRMPAKRSVSKDVKGLAERWRRLRAAEIVWAVSATLLIVLLYVNLASSERKVERADSPRVHHQRFAVRAHYGEPARPRLRAWQQGHRALQRRRGLSRDARGHPLGAPDHHLRELHLLVVVDRPPIHRGAHRARPGRRAHARHHRLGRLPQGRP